jgi:hypothetical protein
LLNSLTHVQTLSLATSPSKIILRGKYPTPWGFRESSIAYQLV